MNNFKNEIKRQLAMVLAFAMIITNMTGFSVPQIAYAGEVSEVVSDASDDVLYNDATEEVVEDEVEAEEVAALEAEDEAIVEDAEDLGENVADADLVTDDSSAVGVTTGSWTLSSSKTGYKEKTTTYLAKAVSFTGTLNTVMNSGIYSGTRYVVHTDKYFYLNDKTYFSLPVDEDTVSFKVSVHFSSNNIARACQIGNGDNKYIISLATKESEYENKALYPADSYMGTDYNGNTSELTDAYLDTYENIEGRFIRITGLVGDVKPDVIKITEYKSAVEYSVNEVSIDSNVSSSVISGADFTVSDNKITKAPTVTAKEGFKFIGWYIKCGETTVGSIAADKCGDDLETPIKITSNATAIAKFTNLNAKKAIVSANTMENGTVTFSESSLQPTEDETVTITASPAEGYYTKSVTATKNGVSINAIKDAEAENKYTISVDPVPDTATEDDVYLVSAEFVKSATIKGIYKVGEFEHEILAKTPVKAGGLAMASLSSKITKVPNFKIDGWYLDEELNQNAENTNIEDSVDYTVYAKCSQIDSIKMEQDDYELGVDDIAKLELFNRGNGPKDATKPGDFVPVEDIKLNNIFTIVNYAGNNTYDLSDNINKGISVDNDSNAYVFNNEKINNSKRIWIGSNKTTKNGMIQINIENNSNVTVYALNSSNNKRGLNLTTTMDVYKDNIDGIPDDRKVVKASKTGGVYNSESPIVFENVAASNDPYYLTCGGGAYIYKVVVEPLAKHTVSVNATNAKVTGVANGDEFAEGKTVSFNVAPATGYSVKSVKKNGTELTGNEGNYSFVMGTEDVIITVETEVLNCAVSVSANNAVVTGVTNGQKFAYGATVSFNVAVNDGYRVTKVSRDSEVLGTTAGDYTFTMGAKNVNITVETEAIPKHAVTVSVNAAEATVSAIPEKVEEGTTVSFNVAPATGYKVKSVEATGATVTDKGNGNYSFVMVTEDVVITVTTEAIEYTVSVSANNATVTGQPAKAKYDETVSFNVAPAAEYEVVSVKANDTVLEGTDGNYSFVMDAKDANITVETKVKKYAVTVSANNATVKGITATELAKGEVVNFTVEVADGYKLASVSANGVAVTKGADDKYSYTMGSEAVVITVETIEIPTHAITVSANKADVTVAESAYEGKTVEFTVAPNAGYEVTAVTADTVSVNKTGDKYSFVMGEDDVEITVATKAIEYSLTIKLVGATEEEVSVSANATKYTVETAPIALSISYNELVFEKVELSTNVGTIEDGYFSPAAGNATITATATVKPYTVSFEVADGVEVTINGVKNDFDSAKNVKYGTKFNVSVNAVNDKVIVDKVTVDGVEVTGAFEVEAGKDSAVVVTVSYKPVNVTVSVNDATLGSASVPSVSYNAFDDADVTVSANTGVDFVVYANGKAVAKNAEGHYCVTFEDDTVIYVEFTLHNYAIVKEAGTGIESIDVATTAHYNDTVSVNVTVKDGYENPVVKVNGNTVSGNSFVMPAEDVTVSATAEAKTYSISVNEVANATVSVNSAAKFDEAVIVKVTPAAGYRVVSVKANDVAAAQTISGDYKFTMPAANVTITVEVAKEYTVTITAGEGTTLTVKNGAKDVTTGSKVDADTVLTVSAEATEGYENATVSVNGVVVSGNTVKVTSDVTITSSATKKVAPTATPTDVPTATPEATPEGTPSVTPEGTPSVSPTEAPAAKEIVVDITKITAQIPANTELGNADYISIKTRTAFDAKADTTGATVSIQDTAKGGLLITPAKDGYVKLSLKGSSSVKSIYFITDPTDTTAPIGGNPTVDKYADLVTDGVDLTLDVLAGHSYVVYLGKGSNMNISKLSYYPGVETTVTPTEVPSVTPEGTPSVTPEGTPTVAPTVAPTEAPATPISELKLVTRVTTDDYDMTGKTLSTDGYYEHEVDTTAKTYEVETLKNVLSILGKDRVYPDAKPLNAESGFNGFFKTNKISVSAKKDDAAVYWTQDITNERALLVKVPEDGAIRVYAGAASATKLLLIPVSALTEGRVVGTSADDVTAKFNAAAVKTVAGPSVENNANPFDILDVKAGEYVLTGEIGKTLQVYGVEFYGKKSEEPSVTPTVDPSVTPTGTPSVKPTVPAGEFACYLVDENGSLKSFDDTELYTATYTGSNITPAVKVYANDGSETVELVNGVDYTVAYKNNKNSTVTKDGALKVDAAKNATITVTGKGNYTSKKLGYFNIGMVDLSSSEVEAQNVIVQNGKKAKVPTVVYNGQILKASEVICDELKTRVFATTDDGTTVKLTAKTNNGKENYYGEKEVDVKVLAQAPEAVSAVKLVANKLAYTGEEVHPEILSVKIGKTVYGKDAIGEKFAVFYPEQSTNVGKYYVTVVGLGEYAGSKSVAYSIDAPKASLVNVTMPSEGIAVDYVAGKNGTPLTAEAISNITLTAKLGDNEATLVYGQDYYFTYSSNKNVTYSKSKGFTPTAKFNIKFTGNYKGCKTAQAANTFVYKINPVELANATVVATDKVIVGTKAKAVKAAPYVFFNQTEVNKSDYTVTYYTDDECKSEMKGSNIPQFSDNEATVYFKITAKAGKNFDQAIVGNTDATANEVTGSYKIYMITDKTKDFTKAKLTFNDKSLAKKQYTGGALDATTEEFTIQNSAKGSVDTSSFDVVGCYNNINLGNAYIIINGSGDYKGTLVAKYSIVKRDMKTLVNK